MPVSEGTGRRCTTLLFLLILAGLFFSSSQSLPNAVAPTPWAGPRPERILVEVIALDKSGQPVGGMKKEDFRLYEDGKEQQIVSFEEVGGDTPQAASGAAGPGKVVLILFDDSRLTGGRYKETRDAAEAYVTKHMRPQDLVAVASNSVSLEIVQSFTQDRSRVLAAIRKVSGLAETRESTIPDAASAASRDSQRAGRTIEDPKAPSALAYQSAAYQAVPLLRSLTALNSDLGRIRGRKAVLFFSEEFAAPASLGKDFASLVKSAREANVAFTTIDARGLATYERRRDGQAPSIPNRTNQRSGSDIDAFRFERQAIEDILRPLAVETRGTPIYNTSDFGTRLDDVDRELSHYYLMGFEAANPLRDGSFRELTVKTGVKNVSVKHRAGYLDPRQLDVLAGTGAGKALLNALASSASQQGLPVTIRAASFPEPDGTASIPISVKIGAAPIQLRKKGNQVGTDLHLLGLAVAEGGVVADRFSDTQHILLDKEFEPSFRRQNLVYRGHFRLGAGRFRLRLAVADEKGNTGTAEMQVDVPAAPAGALAASSVVLADQISQLPELIRGLQPVFLEDRDPLRFNGVRVLPSADNRFPATASVPVFFKLYNLESDAARRKFSARARLLGASGEVRAFPTLPLDENLFATGDNEAIVGFSLPFEKMTPGDYRLVIEVAEATTRGSLTLETDLHFE